MLRAPSDRLTRYWIGDVFHAGGAARKSRAFEPLVEGLVRFFSEKFGGCRCVLRSAAFCDALLDLEPFLEGSSGKIISPQSGPLAVAPLPSEGNGTIRLSLVIPTYCEATNIEPLIAQLIELLESRLSGSYELIVVDDDSPDRTWAVAAELRFPQVRVVRRQGERGLASAVLRGWQLARGDILAVMDADLQHPPEANWGLYQEMMRGADLAGATRNVGGGGVSDWSIQRRVVSRAAQLLGLLLLPEVFGRVSDPMSGFFMVRRSAIAGVPLSPIGYKILMEVVARGRVRWIGEVPYEFRERLEGETKLTYRVCLEYLHRDRNFVVRYGFACPSRSEPSAQA